MAKLTCLATSDPTAYCRIFDDILRKDDAVYGTIY